MIENLIFDQTIGFSTKISLVVQNFEFWRKCRFLTKISIFGNKWNIWTKIKKLGKNRKESKFGNKIFFWKYFVIDWSLIINNINKIQITFASFCGHLRWPHFYYNLYLYWHAPAKITLVPRTQSHDQKYHVWQKFSIFDLKLNFFIKIICDGLSVI